MNDKYFSLVYKGVEVARGNEFYIREYITNNIDKNIDNILRNNDDYKLLFVPISL